MPFDPALLKRLRLAKQLTQSDLTRAGGPTQSQISECEKSAVPTLDVLEKLAIALDCTTDFLLGRSLIGVDMETAASRMAFDVFAHQLTTTPDQRERCRRVLGHRAAPLTADGWRVLAEQIELAIGPTNGGVRLRSIHGGNAS